MADEEYEDDYEDDFEDDDPTAHTPPPISAACANAHADDSPSNSPSKPQYSRSPSMMFPWALVTLEDLDMGERLAAGAMGAVHAGYYRGRPVAIKTLHDVSDKALASVESELLVHAALKGPRTVELIAANLAPPKCCIVMERCEASLFEKLHRRADDMSRRQWLAIAIQVAEGMQFLHTRRPPVVHRDLKSHNVLLDAHGDAKLCDFGLVNTKEITAGTPNYMAPELFLSKPFSTSVDVYAFGVLLNEIWAREVPWDGYQPMDIKDKVIRGERPPTPRTMPYSCENLLKKLWHGTPQLRPTFADAIPSLEAVQDTLPVGNLGGSLGRHGMDSLDSLDALSSLSLKPR